jgi:hypothetical protein
VISFSRDTTLVKNDRIKVRTWSLMVCWFLGEGAVTFGLNLSISLNRDSLEALPDAVCLIGPVARLRSVQIWVSASQSRIKALAKGELAVVLISCREF